jgi:hypothetical protein
MNAIGLARGEAEEAKENAEFIEQEIRRIEDPNCA